MSKYYKAEDVQELITACEWRMTLAKERNGEGFVDYSKQVLDVDELTKRLADLPTIEVSEDCISRKWLEENKAVVIHTNDEWGETEINEYVYWEDVENAPSVVPSIAEGEWIVSEDRDLFCSVCGASEEEFIYGMGIWYGKGDSIYCPNCGSLMKGAE